MELRSICVVQRPATPCLSGFNHGTRLGVGCHLVTEFFLELLLRQLQLIHLDLADHIQIVVPILIMRRDDRPQSEGALRVNRNALASKDGLRAVKPITNRLIAALSRLVSTRRNFEGGS